MTVKGDHTPYGDLGGWLVALFYPHSSLFNTIHHYSSLLIAIKQSQSPWMDPKCPTISWIILRSQPKNLQRSGRNPPPRTDLWPWMTGRWKGVLGDAIDAGSLVVPQRFCGEFLLMSQFTWTGLCALIIILTGIWNNTSNGALIGKNCCTERIGVMIFFLDHTSHFCEPFCMDIRYLDLFENVGSRSQVTQDP